jgi:hypothetical protein
MGELSKSTDPRVRRAYVHVILHRLARGEANRETAQAAIKLANQTRKGRDSFFGRALLQADRKSAETRARQLRQDYNEALRNRLTRHHEFELITAVPFPDGGLVPLVIGAGSGEDVDRIWSEADKVAQGPGGAEAALNHVYKGMAAAGDTVPEFAFWLGTRIGQAGGLDPSQQTEGPTEDQSPE